MERLPRKFSLADPIFKYTAALPWHCQLAASRYGKLLNELHIVKFTVHSDARSDEIRQLLLPWGELRPHALPQEIADFYAQIDPWGEIIYESVGPIGIGLCVGGKTDSRPKADFGCLTLYRALPATRR